MTTGHDEVGDFRTLMETVVMTVNPTKRVKGSVGEGEEGKKAKTNHHEERL
jgi:hypothetical protein